MCLVVDCESSEQFQDRGFPIIPGLNAKRLSAFAAPKADGSLPGFFSPFHKPAILVPTGKQESATETQARSVGDIRSPLL